MELMKLILEIIDIYKPPRMLLHSLVYLYMRNNNRDLRWSLTISGVYSPIVEEIIEELIEAERVKVCENGRLTRDTCPDEEFDGYIYASKAANKYLIEETVNFLEEKNLQVIH